ncbi:MAG: lipopolysaccharide kinase InaA family protein [Zoogloeaceae bacterium]|jgi:hypothetical protein|nr:lipopolysaccharide kinase InaA family protein [Zoogloeaceae bacterium]
MTTHDFIAAADIPLLEAAGLADFDALWQLELETVEHPNAGRGGDGWSSVCRLELPGQDYFLKRQSNHLTRSLTHPFGEPTFAREFRNIRRYAERQVPALCAVFFGMRKIASEQRAILLTRALSGWRDLASWLADWPQCPPEQRGELLDACALLARRLHAARLTHCCFYPHHIFVRAQEKGYAACLIDLEKSRSLHFRRERIRDVEQFLRHAPQLTATEINRFLALYLETPANAPEIGHWRQWLAKRQQKKAGQPPSSVDVCHQDGNDQHQHPGQIKPEQKNG